MGRVRLWGTLRNGRRVTARGMCAAVILAVLAAGCGDAPLTEATLPAGASSTLVTGSTDVPASAQSELEAARARWATAAPATYGFTFADDCGECEPLQRQVVVWDGERASDPQAPDIVSMFDDIAAAIEAGQAVDVVYDPDLGYPAEVWIDREARAYDGGTHWLVTDFAASLPGDATTIERLDAAVARWEAARPQAYEYRTDIICGCGLDGWLWTEVAGSRIVEWEVEIADAESSVSPITIDEMMVDLRELLTTGVQEEGVEITGSAAFDDELGHPTWIGLDIEVQDPNSELGYLPPRLVFQVSEFRALPPQPDDVESRHTDLVEARERWAATGFTDYTYRLTVHDAETADFSEPYLVAVVDGDVVEVVASGVPIDIVDVPAYSIDDLFERIVLWEQSGIDVDALYHHADGYPVLVVQATDEPLVISIEDLQGR